jgi:hypothetical protein
MSTALTIGVAVPDLSEYVVLDPAWSVGNPAEQVQAAVEGARRAGRLPVHGRDVQLVFCSYRANQREEKIAAAQGLVGAGAFAVLGGRDFTAGACWLADAGVPVIDVNAVPSSTLARAAPWMFTLRAAQDRWYRAFVRWADGERHLAGRVVGVFCDRLTREATAVAVDELRGLGHDVRVVLDSEGVGVGSERDDDAPARFAAAGVDLVLGFVGGSSWINTLRACAAQGYRPALVDLETGEHTNDVTARFHPPELYDGTLALTMSRVGDVAAGWPLAAATTAALGDYERCTGTTVAREAPVRSGEWSNVLITADLVTLLLAGLAHAGPEPTREALVGGLEQIRELPMASGADVTFTPAEHWGFRGARTVRWDASRACWVAVTDFEPFR